MTLNLSVPQQARLLHWALDQGLASPAELDLGRGDGSPTLSETDIEAPFRRLFLEGRLNLHRGSGLAFDSVHSALARAHALEALGSPQPGPRQVALRAARAELAEVGRQARRSPATAIALAEAYRLLQQADPGHPSAAAGLVALAPALAGRPWDGYAIYLQSRLLAGLGRREAAERTFQEACRKNPNLVKAAR